MGLIACLKQDPKTENAVRPSICSNGQDMPRWPYSLFLVTLCGRDDVCATSQLVRLPSDPGSYMKTITLTPKGNCPCPNFNRSALAQKVSLLLSGSGNDNGLLARVDNVLYNGSSPKLQKGRLQGLRRLSVLRVSVGLWASMSRFSAWCYQISSKLHTAQLQGHCPTASTSGELVSCFIQNRKSRNVPQS